MTFTEEDQVRHEAQDRCYSCGKEFDDTGLNTTKVRDHCHYTSNYRGALHSNCNLRMKDKKVVPVVFHNLKGYDAHLFIKCLADTEGDINCIPKNKEIFSTFSKKVRVGSVAYIDKKGVER